MSNSTKDQLGGIEGWRAYNVQTDSKSGKQLGFIAPDGEYYSFVEDEEMIFVKSGSSREPKIRLTDGKEISLEEWKENNMTGEQLGRKYWREELQRDYGGDPNNKNFKEFKRVLVAGFRKGTSRGGMVGGEGFFAGGDILRKTGKLPRKEEIRMAGRKFLAKENGLDLGPYKVDANSDVATASVTDVAFLEDIIQRASGKTTIKLDRVESIELQNLFDRAKSILEAGKKQDKDFETLKKLATEWQVKFPKEEVGGAIVGEPGVNKVSKEMRGGKAVILAPESTAELFKMEIYVERARAKISSSNPELDAKKVSLVIQRVLNFTRDMEKKLYPKGYYVVNF